MFAWIKKHTAVGIAAGVHCPLRGRGRYFQFSLWQALQKGKLQL